MKFSFVLLIAVVIFTGCKKEDAPTSNTTAHVTVTDADIYALAETSTATIYRYADAHWSVVDYAVWILKNGARYNTAGTPAPNFTINPNTSLHPWERVNFAEINSWEAAPHSLGFSHQLPPYGDQQYYELIGKYSQFKYGWDTYQFNGAHDGDDGYDVNYIPQQMKDYAIQLAKANDFYYYKHSLTILSRSSASGHTAQPLLRARYNIKAATQLDANGKVKIGAVFPDSSLIVKELMRADSTIEVYAFMFKLEGAANSDANGWLWGEATASGGVAYSVSNKGSGCIGCHSTGIDYTRMNDAHP